MKQNIIQRGLRGLFGVEQLVRDTITNNFNDAFLWGAGGGYTDYDRDARNYINKAYNVNPFVYSVINQQATKTSSIPFYIKKVDDNKSLAKLKRLRKATGNNLTTQQYVKAAILENKAYDKEEMVFPMNKPNASQSWSEFLALFKTFLKATGNVYIYMLSPEDGENAGTPIQVYILPSHLVQIVVKQGVNLLMDDNPVKEYILIDGKVFATFKANDVIHIKYSNPNYNENGSHLYGMSPLRAAGKNIESSNKSLELNIKTLQNGGAFGLIHGKSAPLQKKQADEIKDRLREMSASSEDLSKIAGVSADVGFTRLSLTSDELKPFDYLNFDQKQICNVLGWDDKLLNNDQGAKYDNVNSARKRVVTDNIVPDLNLFTQAMNEKFIPRFKGYENTEWVFDIMELPEMQEDLEKLSAWLKDALDRGAINRNEYRMALRYPEVKDPNMDIYTVNNDVLSLEEAIDNTF